MEASTAEDSVESSGCEQQTGTARGPGDHPRAMLLSSSRMLKPRPGGTAQSAKCLPCKHADPSLDPSTHVKNCMW